MNSVNPLQELSGRLRVGPPSIRVLTAILAQSEEMGQFVNLISAYLPEHKVDILSAPFEERIELFTNYWSEKFFPIDMADDLLDLDLYSINFPRFGLGYDDYHEVPGMENSIVLMLSLVASPYFDDDDDDDDNARIPIIEAATGIVGEEVAARIPKKGWAPDQLRRFVDGTPYETVALYADWLWQGTENVFWDSHFDDTFDNLSWSPENVEWLTIQWREAKEIMARIDNFGTWVNEAPANRMIEILSVIERREKDESTTVSVGDTGQFTDTP